MNKLHVYVLVAYKGEESRVVRIYGTRDMADRAKNKHEFKLLNKVKPKVNRSRTGKRETFHVLKFSVEGAKIDTGAYVKRLFLNSNEDILSVYGA